MKVERKGQGTGRKKNKVPLLTDSLQKTEVRLPDEFSFGASTETDFIVSE